MEEKKENNRIYRYNSISEERRRYKRFPFVFPVKYTYLGNDLSSPKPSEFSLYSFSNNISRGGMMFTLSNDIPVGEYIEIVMTLPVEHEVVTIKAVGKVKWSKKEEDGYFAGIEFVDIKEKDLEIIQTLLEAHSF